MKNATARFKNLSKRISIKKTGIASIKITADAFVSLTLWPLWMKMTIFKALALRFTAGALGRALKKVLSKSAGTTVAKEATETGLKTATEKFFKGGLFTDLIEVTAKEGVEKGGKKILNLPRWISKNIVGSRSFNYGLAGLIWLGYWLVDNPVGRFLIQGKNIILGVFDGEVLGPCAYAALSPIIADAFAPKDNPGVLNKLGITYDMNTITADAYELYAALSPQCFADEEDFATADEVIREFLQNAPSRLYTSLVAREYHKLTGKPEGQVLPEWKDMCRQPLFGKGHLHDDIVQFEKHKEYWADILTWDIEMVRLPLKDYTQKLCKIPFIDKDFDDVVKEVNRYLWTPGAEVPDFIKEVVDAMSIEDLTEMAEGYLAQPEVWSTVEEEFKEIEEKLELQGIEFNAITGDLTLDMNQLLRTQVMLMSSPGIDQLVYIGPEGYFLDLSQLYDTDTGYAIIKKDKTGREEYLGIEPQKMVVKISPSIKEDIAYAIGSVRTKVNNKTNTNALKKNVLCDNNLAETGYLCYLAQFREGSDYREWLPEKEIKDANGVLMSLKNRVPSDRQHEVGKVNPILWEIAAYLKYATTAKEERYRNYLPYKVFPRIY